MAHLIWRLAASSFALVLSKRGTVKTVRNLSVAKMYYNKCSNLEIRC